MAKKTKMKKTKVRVKKTKVKKMSKPPVKDPEATREIRAVAGTLRDISNMPKANKKQQRTLVAAINSLAANVKRALLNEIKAKAREIKNAERSIAKRKKILGRIATLRKELKKMKK